MLHTRSLDMHIRECCHSSVEKPFQISSFTKWYGSSSMFNQHIEVTITFGLNTSSALTTYSLILRRMQQTPQIWASFQLSTVVIESKVKLQSLMFSLSADFEAPDGQDPFQEDKDRLDSHQKSSSSVRKGSNDLERQESGRSLKDGKHPDRSQSAFLTGLLPSHFDVTGDEGKFSGFWWSGHKSSVSLQSQNAAWQQIYTLNSRNV